MPQFFWEGLLFLYFLFGMYKKRKRKNVMFKNYTTAKKLSLCIKFNLFVIGMCVFFFLVCAEPGSFTFGPSDSFEVVGIKINTWTRYITFVMLIILIQEALLMTEEFAIPILEFTVYNPQCDIIIEFSRMELQLFTNVLYMTKEALKLFKVMILIARLDALLFTYLAEEITTIATVHIILSQKSFRLDTQRVEENFCDKVVGIF